MTQPEQWFRFIRLLSIDIALGASATSYYACRLLDINLPHLFWPCQFLAVLIIYLCDHLADSRFLTYSEKNSRYSFYQKWHKLLIGLVVILLISLFILLLYLPRDIWFYGLIGGIFIAIYLVMNQWQNYTKKYLFPRELVIAFFYFYGTVGFPVFLSYTSIRIGDIIMLAAYFFLILSNVIIYAYYDNTLDDSQKIMTIAVRFGREKCKITGYLAVSVSIFLFLGSLLFDRNLYSFCAIGLSILLLYFLIFNQPKWFTMHRRYGVIADIAIILPAILYFIK